MNLLSGKGVERIMILFIWMIPVVCFLFHADNCHDWGDDFAQYLCQAGVFNGTFNSLPVSCLEQYSPAVKGPLFSLVLVPTLSFTAPILAAKCMIICFLAASGHITFLLLKQITNSTAAFSGAMLLILNFTSMRLADQVLPDIPFTMLVLLSLYLVSFKTVSTLRAALFLGAVAAGFRSAGLVLLAVYLVWIILMVRKKEIALKDFLFHGLLLIIPLLISIILAVTIQDSRDAAGWYISRISESFTWSVFSANFIAYKTAFQTLFEYEIPMWLNRITGLMMLIFVIIGYLTRIFKKPGIPDVFFTAYVFMLLVYPYHHEPHRFLFPVFPILLIYVVTAIGFIFSFIKVNNSLAAVFTASFFAGMVLFNYNNLRIHFTQNTFANTCDTDAQELFLFLNREIKPGMKVVSPKPWAIAWYAGIQTVPAECPYSGSRLVLVWNHEYLGSSPDHEQVFSNATFTVFKVN